MAQQGTFGHLDVPVFEKADVDSPYVHIPGHGYLKLDPISEINKPTYVVHANGSKYAVAKDIGNLEIDYFDDEDLTEWDQSDPNNSFLVNDAAGGEHSFYLDGYTRATSNDNSLPNYPIDALNGEWEMWWKANWDPDDLRCEVRWAYEDYNNCYMTKITDGCIRIRVQDPDINQYGTKIVLENFIDFNTHQWYRVLHGWEDNADGSHTLTVGVYDDNGNLIDEESTTIDSAYVKEGRGMDLEAYSGTYIKLDQMAVVQ